MFEATLEHGGLLKKLLQAIQDLITEGNFEISSNGMALQSMDSSHVSLLSLLLRADGFSHYRIDRPFTMGMNLIHVSKMLKCANDNDKVMISVQDGSDVTSFVFQSPKGDRVSEFDMKQMEIQTENLGIPDTQYNAIVRMSSHEFARIIKDLSTVGDTVEISVTHDSIKFLTAGDFCTGNVVVKHGHRHEDGRGTSIVSIDVQESVTLTFALKYLRTFTLATILADKVTLRLSRELPIVVEYDMEGIGYIRYYLAPKIDEEEEEEVEED